MDRQQWHVMDMEEVLQCLKTGVNGLTVAAVPEALSSGYGNSGDWSIKNGQTKFETLGCTTVIWVDKTGTLTKEFWRVVSDPTDGALIVADEESTERNLTFLGLSTFGFTSRVFSKPCSAIVETCVKTLGAELNKLAKGND